MLTPTSYDTQDKKISSEAKKLEDDLFHLDRGTQEHLDIACKLNSLLHAEGLHSLMVTEIPVGGDMSIEAVAGYAITTQRKYREKLKRLIEKKESLADTPISTDREDGREFWQTPEGSITR